MNKRNYLAIFCVILFCNISLGQNINDYSVIRLNDIVGDTIDRNEKERFGLFYDIIARNYSFAMYIMQSEQLKLRIYDTDSLYKDYIYSSELFLKDNEQVISLNENFSRHDIPPKPSKHRNLTLGYRNSGIVIGNSKKCNGIRLNIWDSLGKLQSNGVNIALRSSSMKSNGIDVGLLFVADSIANGLQIASTIVYAGIANGISIGGIGVGAANMNGLALGGIAVGADDANINGVAISGLGVIGENLNGLCVGFLGASNWSDQSQNVNGVALGILTGVRAVNFTGFSAGIIGNQVDTLNGLNFAIYENYSKQVNGIQFACGYNEAVELKGVQIGVYNYTEEASGIQIGIVNYIETKKFFKFLPFINFQLRKDRNESED